MTNQNNVIVEIDNSEKQFSRYYGKRIGAFGIAFTELFGRIEEQIKSRS